MKQFLMLCSLGVLSSSPLWADNYEIWTLERDYIDSNCIPEVVDLDHASIDSSLKEDNPPDDEFAGTICFFKKGIKIVESIDIDDDIDKIYEESVRITAEMAPEDHGPFLCRGKEYLLLNNKTKKYYFCFIEWDSIVFKRFPKVLHSPRIQLAPFAIMGSDVFIYKNWSIIVRGRNALAEKLTQFLKKNLGSPISSEEQVSHLTD